jgi:hypothetical protein
VVVAAAVVVAQCGQAARCRAWRAVQKRLSAEIFKYQNPSICQERLGTIIGKVEGEDVSAGTAIAAHNLVNVQLPLGANASECAAACCRKSDCSGFTYQPTTIARNGICQEGPRPCCWLKANHR